MLPSLLGQLYQLPLQELNNHIFVFNHNPISHLGYTTHSAIWALNDVQNKLLSEEEDLSAFKTLK